MRQTVSDYSQAPIRRVTSRTPQGTQTARATPPMIHEKNVAQTKQMNRDAIVASPNAVLPNLRDLPPGCIVQLVFCKSFMGVETMRLIAIALLLVGSTCFAEEHSDRFVAALRALIETAEKERDELTTQIKAMNSGRIDRRAKEPVVVNETRSGKRYTWRSREDKEKAVAEAQQRLESLPDPMAVLPKLPFANQLAVGMIGEMPETSTTQVFVPIGDLGTMAPQHTFYRCFALQVLDDSQVLVRHESQTLSPVVGGATQTKSEIFLLQAPTDGMVDGQQITVTGVHKVTGTHRYQSQAGARTIFVVEPFDASELVAKARK